MKEFTAKVEKDPCMKFLGITVERVEQGHVLGETITAEAQNENGILEVTIPYKDPMEDAVKVRIS